MHPPGRQRLGVPLGQPAEPGRHVPGVGAAGPRRPQPGQPCGHQDLVPLAQLADHGELGPDPAEQLGRHRRWSGAGDRQPLEVTLHGVDGSGGRRHWNG